MTGRRAAADSAVQLVVLKDAAAQPWRNGGGVTRELLVWPSPERWMVRISVADIDRDGPFSAYPGVSRWFAVLQGGGVELDLAGGPRQLRVGDAACGFDGAEAPVCRLLDGPTRDLNLMLRGADGGLWPVADGDSWSPVGARCGVFTPVPGRVRIDIGNDGSEATDPPAMLAMPAMSLCWWPVAPTRLLFLADANGATTQPLNRGWWLAATPQLAKGHP